MQFNVNNGVVKMLEIIANHKSLQVLIALFILLHELPDLIAAIRWW
ncbi:hypothetical protein [Methylomonas rapida]|uniref:Uncharacterized protein n=1 Tax=Methylomonas rapida TaxID=2963939 RepID=A0ABY7GCC4_9GAMM|nr:hypothetical protein [Methylomonas rapida]WAR42935.1 hypothetical protein NM686_011025 [Methylomonas rapida]